MCPLASLTVQTEDTTEHLCAIMNNGAKIVNDGRQN